MDTATWLQTLCLWNCSQHQITVLGDGKMWLFQLNPSCVIRHCLNDVVGGGVLGRFHSSKPLECIDIRMQWFQRDDVNFSYCSPMDSAVFCCAFCLLCQRPILLPHEYFPFLFPIYLSINLLNSLGRSLWTQCVIGEGCFYRVQVTLWSAVSAAPRRLMPVLCPRASVIIFMTLIKCAVNIKALKWWRWNHFELRTGSLSLFFCLPLNIFLLKCIWNTPFFHWGVILKIWRHTCPLTIMKRFKEGIML